MNSTQIDILLVDDSQENVGFSTQILEREKLATNIHVVRDGEDALDFFSAAELSPNAVLITLPKSCFSI
jgi:CheY-like chemotaxis protein